MDTNSVYQALALATSVVGLLKLARYRFRVIGWTIVFATLLGVVITGHYYWRPVAGYVSLAVWIPFVFLPMIGQSLLFRLQLKDRWEAATWLARGLAILHPFDGWVQQPRQFMIIGALQRGETDEARQMLPKLQLSNPRLASFVYQHLLRVENRWQELRLWIETHVPDLSKSPGASVLYTRALGETGNVPAMLRHHDRHGSRLPPPMKGLSQLYAAAFSGRVSVMNEGLAGAHRGLAPETREFWRATTLQAAGRDEEARAILDDLAEGEGLIRESARYRIESPVPHFDVTTCPDETRATVAKFEHDMIGDMRFTTVAGLKRPILTWSFILVNAIAFSYQIMSRSRYERDEDWVIDLGALLVPAIGDPVEWWRVWTAGFLHAGALHIVLNMGALWYLGRKVEAIWGRVTLAVVYLGATFGSNALVLLYKQREIQPQPMVGASAGVMGVFGALGILAFMSWKDLKSEALRRLFTLMMFLFLLQIGFDYMLRGFVAWYAHLSGMLLGIAIAVLLRLVSLTDKPDSNPRETHG